MRLTQLALALLLPSTLAVGQVQAQARPELARQVFEAESSFAASMANRDLTEFGRYVASDAIFFGEQPLRGRTAVVGRWRVIFDKGAPFCPPAP